MKITVNGEARELPEGLTLATLLEQVGSPRVGIAVARNERVVRRSDYDGQVISDGDAIEIIKAVAGG